MVFMQDVSEILDFTISTSLFIYLLTLFTKERRYLKTWWYWGIVFILFSKVNTILEGLVFSEQINIIEHSFFLIACIFLFISILKKEL